MSQLHSLPIDNDADFLHACTNVFGSSSLPGSVPFTGLLNLQLGLQTDWVAKERGLAVCSFDSLPYMSSSQLHLLDASSHAQE